MRPTPRPRHAVIRQPRTRRPRHSRLQLQSLEGRINPTGSADVLTAFNTGLDGFGASAGAVAGQGAGSDVPAVKQTFAGGLKVGDQLKQIQQVLKAKVSDPQAALDAVSAIL